MRRLEALRRGGVGVERLPDGSWRVPADLAAQAEAFERKGAARRPVQVELLSPVPLQRLPRLEGATWLDRQLAGEEQVPLRDAGFGREVRSALALRRMWLIESGFARDLAGGPAYAGDMLEALRRRELARTAAQLGDQRGLSYAEAGPGMRFTGIVERRVDLASGRFALVTNSREFSLVPWRQGLERQLGRSLELQLKGSGLSWTLGRERAGPEIG